jgi:hypothetical protein
MALNHARLPISPPEQQAFINLYKQAFIIPATSRNASKKTFFLTFFNEIRLFLQSG